MKILNKMLCIAALALAGVSAFAQEANKETVYEDNNRNADGSVAFGPYLTNKGSDNWFVGAGVGVNVFSHNKMGFKSGWTFPAVDAYFGKWLTPTFAFRLGYQGFQGKEDATEVSGVNNIEKFRYFYFHADALWNISNQFGGYKETRFWSFVPYAHAGYLRLYDVQNSLSQRDPHPQPNEFDNEFAAGAGLLNLLRVSKRINVTLDFRAMVFSGRFHNWNYGGIAFGGTALAGIQVGLGKTGWTRASSLCSATALADAQAALAAANDALAASRAAEANLREELKKCNERPAGKDVVTVEYALGVPPITLFFDLNSTELNYTERQHLSFYVENVMEKDASRSFYLTGSADKATGNDDINSKLSRARVENVIKVLNEEYGIPMERLILKGAKISSDHPEDPRLDRSVLIEH